MFTRRKVTTTVLAQHRVPYSTGALLGAALLVFTAGCDRQDKDTQSSATQDTASKSSTSSQPEKKKKRNKKSKKLDLGEPCKKDRDCESDVCRRVSSPRDFAKNQGKKLCSECDSHNDCGPKGACVWGMEEDKPAYSCITLREDQTPDDPSNSRLGTPCKSDKDCGPVLKCSEIVEGGFGTKVFTCGECSIASEDCGGRHEACITHPNNKYNLCANTVGAKDDSPCRSDSQCENFCEHHEINVGDIFRWGFCVVCTSDEHCGKKGWCRRAVVDEIEHTLTPAKCETGEKPDTEESR